MTTDPLEIAWLAGLLEGEGNFAVYTRPKSKRPSFSIKLKMTDADVVRRAKNLAGCDNAIVALQDPRPNHSSTFEVRIGSRLAEEVALAVLPYMGERRFSHICRCLRTELGHRAKNNSDAPALPTRQPMTAAQETRWLAGLLEGEGWFCTTKSEPYRARVRVGLQMNDQDVVERAKAVIKTGCVVRRRERKVHADGFQLEVSGSEAEAVALRVLPFMGERRATKIREILKMDLSHYPRKKSAPKPAILDL